MILILTDQERDKLNTCYSETEAQSCWFFARRLVFSRNVVLLGIFRWLYFVVNFLRRNTMLRFGSWFMSWLLTLTGWQSRSWSGTFSGTSAWARPQGGLSNFELGCNSCCCLCQFAPENEVIIKGFKCFISSQTWRRFCRGWSRGPSTWSFVSRRANKTADQNQRQRTSTFQHSEGSTRLVNTRKPAHTRVCPPATPLLLWTTPLKHRHEHLYLKFFVEYFRNTRRG